jgi:hypothetical protein
MGDRANDDAVLHVCLTRPMWLESRRRPRERQLKVKILCVHQQNGVCPCADDFAMQVEVPTLSEHRGWSWQIEPQEGAG